MSAVEKNITEIKSGFTLENAYQLASAAHEGQLDPSGENYIFHPETVAGYLQGDLPKMVGLLHDVVEDTEITFEDLKKIGVPAEVIDALHLLFHKPNLTRKEYLLSIKHIVDSGNQLAIDAKYADLTHDSDLTRISNPEPKDYARRGKYIKAKQILKPAISKYLRTL